MDFRSKFNTEHFAQYLQSMVKLDELQKMTDNLDQELRDSQYVLNEIKTVFETLPKAKNTQHNTASRHEEISQFLIADVPNLLLPDMTENTADIDLDELIATMKTYAEDLRKNFTLTQPKEKIIRTSIKNLNLETYATSLDQLAKQIEKMKINNISETNRNEELEQKLNQLCQDVNLFTQMVQTKTKLSEANKYWSPIQQDDSALLYDNVISKVLAGINEVTYLLKNRN